MVTPTPQERLMLSRRAIVRHMNREELSSNEEDEKSANARSDGEKKSHGNWELLKHAVQTWWYHHPANVALDLAQPVIKKYAGDHPVQLLAVAAAVGALTVLAKPWRLISLGGLLLSTVKSANVSSILLSMLSSSTANNLDAGEKPAETL